MSHEHKHPTEPTPDYPNPDDGPTPDSAPIDGGEPPPPDNGNDGN